MLNICENIVEDGRIQRQNIHQKGHNIKTSPIQNIKSDCTSELLWFESPET